MPHIDNNTSPAEVAYSEGQPLKLGDNGDYEVQQNPLTGRLEITDTQSGETAYVDPDRTGSLGGDGVFIRSFVEGKPLADDGNLYDTAQAAENAASSWMFIPPGTYNENVQIYTDGLWVQGAGYSTLIDSPTHGVRVMDADNVTISGIRARTPVDTDETAINGGKNSVTTIQNCWVDQYGKYGIGNGGGSIINCHVDGSGSSGGGDCDTFAVWGGAEETVLIVNNTSLNSLRSGVMCFGDDGATGHIIAGNYIEAASQDGVNISEDTIVIGNRIHNCGDNGLSNTHNDSILANNRISGSTNADIADSGTGTLLDANVTGAAN